MNRIEKKFWKRFAGWTLVSLLLLILLSAIFLIFISERLIMRELTRQMNDKTKGSYTLASGDLSISLFKRSITFTDLRIVKNQGAGTNHTETNYFAAASLSFKKINIHSLIASKRLHLKKLTIDQPVFYPEADTISNVKTENPFDVIRQLRPVFNTYLQSLTIDEVELTHAGFSSNHFLKGHHHVAGNTNFNVNIVRFYTDSVLINQKEDFFNADNIFLSIDNYHKTLADKVHWLKIQKIEYSLKDKGITGSNIELAPIDPSIQSSTHYFVKIPEIKIESHDLKNLFQKDRILIDSLFLGQANIKVVPQKDAPEFNLRKMKEFDLYKLIEGELDQLTIKHLAMNAEVLRIERVNDEKTSTQEIRKLNIQLDNFQLNENSDGDLNKVLYSDDLFLQIGHYYLLMNDGVHRFDAENISANSKSNVISAYRLLLRPLQDPWTELTTVRMQCDSIRLTDIDLKRLFHKREMPLQSISAFKPLVTINQGKKQRKEPGETSSLLYHFIGNYIRGVYANVVAFEEGKLTINTREEEQQAGVISSDFNFRLTDFSLDSVSANRSDKLFFATNIDLVFSNYKMKLADQIHRLEIRQINVSSNKNQASIRELHLFPDEPGKTHQLLKKYNRSQTYDIKVPYLELNNTNIHQAFFRKNLRINNISIIKPEIYFEAFSRQEDQEENITPREFYELLNNYIENISIGKISVPNGTIQLVTHSKKGRTVSFNNKFSLELENFALNDLEIEKNKLLFSDEFELKVEDHLFQLSDNVHYLQASEIGISSKRSEIFIKNAILYPNITSKFYGELPWYLYVSIPEIKLQGVDLEEAYFKQKFVVDQFHISQPEIKFYHARNNKTANLIFRNISVPLPKEIALLSIGQFNLNKGSIRIFNIEKFNETEILNSSISMIGENSRLISQGTNKPASFESDNISTTFRKLNFRPEKGKMTYTADQVQFSTKGGNLKIAGLLLKSHFLPVTEKYFQLKVPSVNFEKLNMDEAINKNSFRFELIQAESPELTIKNTQSDSTLLKLFQLKIPGGGVQFINHLSAGLIKLNNARLNMIKEDRTEEIGNINLSLREFSLDTVPSNEFLGAGSVDFTLKNYAFTDRRNYYNFHFDEISFNNLDRRVSISGISINPRYSKEQFQNVIQFQEDHYQGNIAAVDLFDIDLRRWSDSHELIGSHAVVNHAFINIYRDKRTLFNEKQRSKLPQELIKNLQLPVYFDTIKLANSTIRYEEQNPGLPLPATVFFDQVNLTAFPVTNLPYLLNMKPTLNVSASALLMGNAFLQTTMSYDMLSADSRFHVKGKIKPFDLTILNPVTRNAAEIAIRSGQLNRFDFEFDANDRQANGKLRFAYDDLKVSILEQRDGATKEAKFASFLTNSLVLNSKNPRTRILLPDEIRFDRDPKRSVINYWWKSVFSGAKNTFGIKEDKD